LEKKEFEFYEAFFQAQGTEGQRREKKLIRRTSKRIEGEGDLCSKTDVRGEKKTTYGRRVS